MKAIDVQGKRFGRLFVKEIAETGIHQRTWLCICDCGNEVNVTSTRLVSGDTASCGCLRREVTAARARENRKHGMKGSREYSSWASMLSRCSNERDANFSEWGGRGIKVCERWRAFEAFFADMGPRPEGMSLDRIDVNGHYEPGNCRWATVEQQNNNRRTTRLIEFNGRVQSLAQWAREIGVTSQCLLMRLRTWSIEKALTAPLQVQRHKPLKEAV